MNASPGAGNTANGGDALRRTIRPVDVRFASRLCPLP
jgi:hypothetical protein